MIPHDASIDDDELPPDLYLIRLRGPWRATPGGEAVPPQDGWTVRMPLTAPEQGRLQGRPFQLERRFQSPTGLDPEERVLLVLPPGCHPQRVRVNDDSLEPPRSLHARLTWDLTPHLEPSNLLQLEFLAQNRASLSALEHPVLIAIMPDADGSWWSELPAANP